MMTITNEQLSSDENTLTETSYRPKDNTTNKQPLSAKSADTDIATQLLIPYKFITHTPKAGLNPLVDAAAYLFSIVGRIKQLKSYRHLDKLRKELIHEINAFQDAAKLHGYSSEYILVSRYAICASLDDIISNTPWGAQGQWDAHTLLAAFNQESADQDRFFVILERLIKDPQLYIDVMEFMYICLSLGFKGHYRATEYNNNQLEQIINALYKRIRAYRGDFSKTLSPYPIKPIAPQKSVTANTTDWLIALLVISVSLVLAGGIKHMLNTGVTPASQDVMHMEKSTLDETHTQTVQ